MCEKTRVKRPVCEILPEPVKKYVKKKRARRPKPIQKNARVLKLTPSSEILRFVVSDQLGPFLISFQNPSVIPVRLIRSRPPNQKRSFFCKGAHGTGGEGPHTKVRKLLTVDA
jgi:hypothetical protein